MVGEIPTSSVNMATQAGHKMSISSGLTRRTSGSGGTSGGPDVTMSGCTGRISLAGPQCGRSSPHRAWTADAGPTTDEHRRPWRRRAVREGHHGVRGWRRRGPGLAPE